MDPREQGGALGLADDISDFEDGYDRIGLEGGLQFSDLTISDGGTADTTISITGTGEILTVVLGVMDNLLTESDFTIV